MSVADFHFQTGGHRPPLQILHNPVNPVSMIFLFPKHLFDSFSFNAGHIFSDADFFYIHVEPFWVEAGPFRIQAGLILSDAAPFFLDAGQILFDVGLIFSGIEPFLSGLEHI